MRSEMPKTLLILGLTVLLCIAFENESSAYGMAVVYPASVCSSSFFEALSCNLNNEIHMINALYGYSYCDDPGGVCCPDAINDCFLSIPSNNFDYYQTLIDFCNNRVRCRPYANSTDADVECHGDTRQQSDYVRLEYSCVPSSKTMMTATACRNSSNGPFSTTLSCAENESIVLVGAILGFQDSAAESSCRPGEDRCRVHPATAHLDCIQTACHGQQSCTIYAADSAPASHTCSEFAYMYENITYYCDDKEPVSPVSQVEPSCWSPSSSTTLFRLIDHVVKQAAPTAVFRARATGVTAAVAADDDAADAGEDEAAGVPT